MHIKQTSDTAALMTHEATGNTVGFNSSGYWSITAPVSIPSATSGAVRFVKTVTLVGGTKTVANTTVTANTNVIAVKTTAGGTEGHIRFSVSAGTSFTLTSSSGTDTSTFNCWLIEAG